MYSRTDLFAIAKAFGSPLTGQTLRNYTKAGLCSGVVGSASGLARQGTFASYGYETVIEAIVSRMLLTKNGRKLVISAVAFGRFVFHNVISDPSFVFDSAHILPLVETFFPGAVSKVDDSYGPRKTTLNVRVSPKEEYTLQDIMDVAREWCIKYAILITVPISMEQVADCIKTNKVIDVDFSMLVQVDADSMYFLQSGRPVGDKVVIDSRSRKIKRITADI